MRRTARRLGQHFLERAWVAKVLDALAPRPADSFIEIGAGQGALTVPLAARVARVVALEIDRHMAAKLAAAVPANVTVVQGDFLRLDAREWLDRLPGGQALRVAGNLPYSVSTPILRRLLALADEGRQLADATLMLQREVADRLLAQPGSRHYGSLTVCVQLHADVIRLFDVPPGAFRPVPKVRSALVRLAFREPLVKLTDPVLFDRLVQSLFAGRRKMLSNALEPFADSQGQRAAEALRLARLDSRRRPETLQVVELARLAAFFSAHSGPRVL